MNTKDLETNKISQKYLVTFMDFGCPEQPNYLLINLGSFKQGNYTKEVRRKQQVLKVSSRQNYYF